MAVTMKKAAFWDVAPCRLCDFSHPFTLVRRSRISYTLKMDAIRSSETSVNTIYTWRHIPEDGILFHVNYRLPLSQIYRLKKGKLSL
jgi:hypothetical protein